MERLSPLFNRQGLLGSSKRFGYRSPSTTENLRICIRPMLFTKKLFRWIIVPCQIWKKCGVLESRCTWRSRTSMMLLRLLSRCCFRNKVMDLVVLIAHPFLERKDKYLQENKSQNQQLTHSIRLWSLYIDMELNLGTLATIKTAYQKTIEMKIITPQLLLNYTDYLISN